MFKIKIRGLVDLFGVLFRVKMFSWYISGFLEVQAQYVFRYFLLVE